MDNSQNGVTSVERALSIIEYISAVNAPVNLKNIAQELSIPITSAFRMVKTLVKRGYLLETNNNGMMYSIGSKIAQLAYHSYSQNISIDSVAKPFMKKMSENTNQTSQLGILSNSKFIYIEQVLPPVPVNFIAPLHTPIALNFSAGAKIILAHKSEDFQRDFIAKEKLEPLTRNTLVDPEALMKDLKYSFERGYAVDDEEFAIGIGCLFMPIKDYKKECIGCIGITGQIQYYRDEKTFSSFLKEVEYAAKEISYIYGFTE